ncbi:IS66 family insertion sequence element accessory protein TnpB [Pseudoduganella sp. R-34]|uniref:IS66 family insertion sequence element accessory protein TnpB n=1 Tax=Pseudoduganella sp. R-34 TaxID=3404062 RepID=UPI003CF0680E
MRSGFNGLAAKMQTALEEDPFSGHVFVFRGRRGDLIKLLWWTGDGLCLLAKRLERGRFIWPQACSSTFKCLTWTAVKPRLPCMPFLNAQNYPLLHGPVGMAPVVEKPWHTHAGIPPDEARSTRRVASDVVALWQQRLAPIEIACRHLPTHVFRPQTALRHAPSSRDR